MKQTASNYYFSQILFDVSMKKRKKEKRTEQRNRGMAKGRVTHVSSTCNVHVVSHMYKHNIIKHSTFTRIQYAHMYTYILNCCVVSVCLCYYMEWNILSVSGIRFPHLIHKSPPGQYKWATTTKSLNF